LPYQQTWQGNIGVDAEQVRNTVQNKLIHDMVFLPKAWRPKTNCHIPMLDKNNNAYLFHENQEIKSPRFYLNAFTNASCFY